MSSEHLKGGYSWPPFPIDRSIPCILALRITLVSHSHWFLAKFPKEVLYASTTRILMNIANASSFRKPVNSQGFIIPMQYHRKLKFIEWSSPGFHLIGLLWEINSPCRNASCNVTFHELVHRHKSVYHFNFEWTNGWREAGYSITESLLAIRSRTLQLVISTKRVKERARGRLQGTKMLLITHSAKSTCLSTKRQHQLL